MPWYIRPLEGQDLCKGETDPPAKFIGFVVVLLKAAQLSDHPRIIPSTKSKYGIAQNVVNLRFQSKAREWRLVGFTATGRERRKRS